MVGLGRLELPTSHCSGVRSNQLSYRPVVVTLQINPEPASCGLGRLELPTSPPFSFIKSGVRSNQLSYIRPKNFRLQAQAKASTKLSPSLQLLACSLQSYSCYLDRKS